MESAAQIAERIRRRIHQLYNEPQFAAYTVGELDALIGELPWLLAAATGRLKDYVRLMGNDRPEELRRREDWRKVHKPFEVPDEVADVVEWWKRFDLAYGLTDGIEE